MTEKLNGSELHQATGVHIEKDLRARKGDFLLSRAAFPFVDSIVFTNSAGKPTFSPGILQSYLNLLELVVLNERVIVGGYDVYQDLHTTAKESLAYRAKVQRYRARGDLNLRDGMLRDFEDQGVLYRAVVVREDASPQSCVTKYLPLSGHLREYLESKLKSLSEVEEDEQIVADLALRIVSEEIGLPLYLSETARLLGVPYLLSSQEVSAVAQIESLEIGLQNGVTSLIKDRLDEGAKQELRRLAQVGIRTIFPWTPISWQIIRESNRPEDFPGIALQLREEYSGFRSEMVELEAELLDEGVSLKRKTRLLRRLHMMADELWPSGVPGIRKEATELSGLLNLVPMSPNAASLGCIADLVNFVLSRPTDLILRALRRRRIRVLLKAKKDFVLGREWSGKLAEIFDLPQTLVKEALVDASADIEEPR